MDSDDNSLFGLNCSPRRDRGNLRRVRTWSLFWAISFIALALGIKKVGLPSGAIFAGVIANFLLGLVTVLTYRRFLLETDELRRKIEVEALAFAFGIGLFGGLSYWLLVVSGIAPVVGFAYIFTLMVLSHGVGVLIGRRRYS